MDTANESLVSPVCTLQGNLKIIKQKLLVYVRL